MNVFKIRLDNAKLGRRIEFALNTPILLGNCRYVNLGAFALGLMTGPGVVHAIFLISAGLFHTITSPYIGFNVKYKPLHPQDNFYPLKRWMVPYSSESLTESEALEVGTLLHDAGVQKMNDLHDMGHKLTVYDAANLILLDHQHKRTTGRNG